MCNICIHTHIYIYICMHARVRAPHASILAKMIVSIMLMAEDVGLPEHPCLKPCPIHATVLLVGAINRASMPKP